MPKLIALCSGLTWISIVSYLLARHDDKKAAIAILVIYFALFLPMAAAFFRLVLLTLFDPPYLPRGAAATHDQKSGRRQRKAKSASHDMEGSEYLPTVEPAKSVQSPDLSDLEQYHKKDIFVCEQDGKPKWCSECAAWKPDRTHHSSDCGRCIRRMDHFCPW